jgi:acetylornithine deacetylase/succinyl-diaminopimelate desuccinylase-like protein
MTDDGLAVGLAALQQAVAAMIDDAVAICQVPAPTFREGERAAFVRSRGTALGLGAGVIDGVGNVIWEVPGDAARATILLTAHLDTVFDAGVHPRVERRGSVLAAPGIGDNSLGVAAVLHCARAAAQHARPRGTLIAAANVGEEGLGNLRGMRALWDRYGARAGGWVVLEGGAFGEAEVAGVASRRYRITVTARGGHSWRDFGAPSAIHTLARLVAACADLAVPVDPRTTYNVGVIDGGTSVNTIAAGASCLLDLRSESPDALAALDDRVQVLAKGIAARAGTAVQLELIGDRAGGRLRADHWIVRLVNAAAASSGAPVEWTTGSTDANVPLSHGAPAVCLGIGRGRGIHTLAEEVDTAMTPAALSMVYRVLATMLARPAAGRD